MSNLVSSRRLRRSVAALSAGLLFLAACGGGDDAEADSAPGDREQPGTPSDQATGNTEDTGEVLPPEYALDEEPTVPDGFRLQSARCDSDEERGAWVALAVPEDWELRGTSSGGSGSPLDENTTLDFSTTDGSVTLEITPDQVGADGTVLGPDGQPWESFDYEWNSYSDEGEKSGTITFESLETVTLADQEVEIFVAERDQDRDQMSATEHKVRVQLAEVPSYAPGGPRTPVSAVLSISHDPDQVTLDSETITDLVGSLAMPPCTRERVAAQYEMALGVDLDGDGRVASIEDLIGGELPNAEDLIGQD